ncbi:hypothetical protein G15_0102 [Enterococcus avium]|nr:hypothetical protein G15_0102 [Enterococcus avium]
MAKGLSFFEHFDANRYFKGKTLIAMKSEELKDFNTQEVLGAKYTVVVWTDQTEYSKEGISNAGDTYTIKIIGQNFKEIKKPIEVSLINPQAKVYGDFRNELSVTADDIRFNTKQEKN